MKENTRIIISGGGTGGHVFPAISIANSIKELVPNVEILFVGAENKMEMEKVPAAGYEIVGLPVSGFDRTNMKRNVAFIPNLLKSIGKAKKIIKTFKPDIAVGVGGYASGPTLYMANKLGIPTVIQEQNSYAGMTNKILSKKAAKICVAYDNMHRFFPSDKISFTGNPVRQQLLVNLYNTEEAYKEFGFVPTKKTLLIVGGSLGARTINQSILKHIGQIAESGVQVIWQTGKYYFDSIKEQTAKMNVENILITDFVARMDLAYSISDLVISRAGASSISELSLLRKPCILVPSPNVSEDHQTQNALALVEKQAAVMVTDQEAPDFLVATALTLIQNETKLSYLSQNIAHFAKPNAANQIAKEILRIIGVEIKAEEKKSAKTTIKQSKFEPKNYYFLGIGGIGMSALARYFKQMGHQVGGYDATENKLTASLEAEGMEIHYKDNVSDIPVKYMDKDNTTIIYTPAISNTMSERVFFAKAGFTMLKRAEVLGEITQTKKALCIAGTHGKTTTSSILAHLLTKSAKGTNAFLGGITKNYASNLLVNPNSDLVVVEADEYDRSFHQLMPYMAVITATDNDHLDIYKDRENLLESFQHFTSLIQEKGCLLVKKGIELTPRTASSVSVYTYSGTETADYYAKNTEVKDGNMYFDFIAPSFTIEQVQLGVPIAINVENSVAAMAIASLNGVTADELKVGIETFKGIERRFDFQIQTENMCYIDDYAHHPEELKASIESIRMLYPNKSICGVFQPHLYTRTRDFAAEFATSLSLLDSVILLDIYPARELPIKGVSSKMILQKIKSKNKSICKKEDLLEEIKKYNFDVLITLGAGDIDKMVPLISKQLKQNTK